LLIPLAAQMAECYIISVSYLVLNVEIILKKSQKHFKQLLEEVILQTAYSFCPHIPNALGNFC
jgi:hypothetical protein